jgi:hypothetical protein
MNWNIRHHRTCSYYPPCPYSSHQQLNWPYFHLSSPHALFINGKPSMPFFANFYSCHETEFITDSTKSPTKKAEFTILEWTKYLMTINMYIFSTLSFMKLFSPAPNGYQPPCALLISSRIGPFPFVLASCSFHKIPPLASMSFWPISNARLHSFFRGPWK